MISWRPAKNWLADLGRLIPLRRHARYGEALQTLGLAIERVADSAVVGAFLREGADAFFARRSKRKVIPGRALAAWHRVAMRFDAVCGILCASGLVVGEKFTVLVFLLHLVPELTCVRGAMREDDSLGWMPCVQRVWRDAAIHGLANCLTNQLCPGIGEAITILLAFQVVLYEIVARDTLHMAQHVCGG
jgi:hypothetical protein